ncbi:hypothetical protein AKO1_002436 [Acrasis kona]|uniref:Xylosidase n=1 Tax=Acrasis kona TaxID=1008807 RepID=A0AAW2YT25_9EUKA
MIKLLVAIALVSIAYCDVDANTMNGKVVVGYQGWFNHESDGFGVGWRHWSKDEHKVDTDTLNFDLWPDTTEYDPQAMKDTNLRYQNGQVARLYSSGHPSIVDKHFEWMKNYNIDSAFLQRFLGEVQDPRFFKLRNTVTRNMMTSAETHGRTFAIMYDVSGVNANNLVDLLKKDWGYLSGEFGVTRSPRYQKHDNKPVVVIWGLGFSERQDTPNQAIEIANYLKSQNCFCIAGVPYFWRTQDRDARPGFVDALLNFDGVSPWAVGRYGSRSGFESTFDKQVPDDQRLTLSRNKWYAPVLFPGFSWKNLSPPGRELNQIPRNGGDFFRAQAERMLIKLQRTNTFLYIAMFDEVDEATAIFKAASRKEDTPVGDKFLYLSIDGKQLPSDYYLKLAGNLTTAWKH